MYIVCTYTPQQTSLFMGIYMAKNKDKNWIAGAIKKPGALHEDLGVPKGKKIPVAKLKEAEKKGGVEGKRAHLAETLKKLNKKKRK